MATLQERNGSYRIQFLHHGKLHNFTVGRVAAGEAESKLAQVEYLLMRLKQKLILLPDGIDIVTFIKFDGIPPTVQTLPNSRQIVTLGLLRDRYIDTHSNGTLEANTLYTCRIHFKHLCRHMGEGFPLGDLSLSALQGYVTKRGNDVSPTTIKKELATFRTAWNWGELTGLTKGKFPNKGLRYAKEDEKPPFMTMDEIARQINAGGKSDLWDCLYLRVEEIEKLLGYVKEKNPLCWVYPLFCFAAHTGARRSEIIRAKIADVDFAEEVITLREKKRRLGERTTRRVPLTPFLKVVLQEWLTQHPGGSFLFCHGEIVAHSRKRSERTGFKGKNRSTSLQGRMANVRKRGPVAIAALTKNEVHHYFKETLAGSQWEVVKGLHTLRHSFISACAAKGTDQRMLETWSGHMSPEMSRRYTHLRPDRQKEELKKVFGAELAPPVETVRVPREQ